MGTPEGCCECIVTPVDNGLSEVCVWQSALSHILCCAFVWVCGIESNLVGLCAFWHCHPYIPLHIFEA